MILGQLLQMVFTIVLRRQWNKHTTYLKKFVIRRTLAIQLNQNQNLRFHICRVKNLRFPNMEHGERLFQKLKTDLSIVLHRYTCSPMPELGFIFCLAFNLYFVAGVRCKHWVWFMYFYSSFTATYTADDKFSSLNNVGSFAQYRLVIMTWCWCHEKLLNVKNLCDGKLFLRFLFSSFVYLVLTYTWFPVTLTRDQPYL